MQGLCPSSAIEGVVWPAVPDQRGSAILAILFQLEQSQWWRPDELLGWQFNQLGLLVAHARRTVPFYRERFGLTGIEPDGPLSLDDWRQIPLLTRSEIQAAGEALLSQQVPSSHGNLSDIFTSGSTGKPIRARRTQLSQLFWSAFTIRDHLWHRRDMSGTLAAIRESGKGKALYPKGAVAPNWGRSSSQVFNTGPCVSLNILCPIEQQIEWLQRQDPDFLLTHPSMAHELARRCLTDGIKLARLRQVQTISEILMPATREICHEAWGAPVVDMYTAREAGYLALQCPEHEHYHVQAEGAFVEILDKDGRACEPGEIGRVVVTPLHNFAMPLIRYDIGDYAEVGEPCPCGRQLPTLRRILGRAQNMLAMPNGEKRWPLLSSADIRSLLNIAPIRRYQFVQKSAERLELRIEVPRRLSSAEESDLCSWICQKFGYPFEVSIVVLDEIPRSGAGKFQDFISEMDS